VHTLVDGASAVLQWTMGAQLIKRRDGTEGLGDTCIVGIWSWGWREVKEGNVHWELSVGWDVRIQRGPSLMSIMYL
jgi:hypothetical protein